MLLFCIVFYCWTGQLHCRSDVVIIVIINCIFHQTGVCSDWSWAEKYFKSKRSVTSDKSAELAAELRTAGNRHFQKKDFKAALQYYNQVVSSINQSINVRLLRHARMLA